MARTPSMSVGGGVGLGGRAFELPRAARVVDEEEGIDLTR